MWYSKVRVAAVACALATALLLAPSHSEGGLCDWLFPWASPAPVATTYAPPYTAQRVSLMPIVSTSYSACSPCSYTAYMPTAQTCYYAPQTAYRWSYSRIERTSYRPITSLDPCTGCATTAYQPVTRRSFLPWLHRRPVTSYRMVCSSGCAPSTTVCSPICGSACGPVCGSACSPYCPVPSISGSVVGSSCPSGCVPATTFPGPVTSSPSLDPGYVPPSTFRTEGGAGSSGTSAPGTPEATSRYRPSSDLKRIPSSTEPPKLIDPYNRTAAKPIHYATYRQLTEVPAANAASGSAFDVGGWRASRD